MGKRFVSIWFPNLATDWFAIQQPDLGKAPFVLCAPSHGRLVVTAADPKAQASGIYVGMVFADARAILPSIGKVDDQPEIIEKLLKRIAEWCIRFSPVTSYQLPDGIVIDATGCCHLWGGEQKYLADISTRLLNKGYRNKAGIADTIGAAWAIARYGGQMQIIPPSQQLEILLNLPPESLRLDHEIIERLHKLGLRKIKDFLAMPRTALRRRFGTSLLHRLNQAVGMEEEYLDPIVPVTPYQERLPCLDPIQRIEGIKIAVEKLIQKICDRLTQEGKGIRSAILKCFRLDGKEESVSISTISPTVNTKHLFHLFELKLSTIEPDLGIELFILEATKVENYLPSQEQLWKENGSINHKQLSELLDRIAGKLGNHSIERYLPAEHHWPERSFKPANTILEEPACEWKVERPRPLRLLRQPDRIYVTAPIPDYPPMLFKYKGTLHKVIKADGPERIEQEWWLQEGQHRDYYTVEDESGCRYWIFRSGHYDAEKKYQWYIHGFFA